MRPASGSSSPARSRQSVVLPTPFGPTSPIRAPSGIRHDSSRKSRCPAYAFPMSSTWIMSARPAAPPLGSGLPRGLDLLGQDLYEHADFAGLAVRVRVLAEVLLGERIDVRVGALLRHLGHASADLDVPVRIVRVLDRERHLRILPEVLFLHPAARRVTPHVGAVPVAPDRCDPGCAVAPDCRQVGKWLLREEVALVIRFHRHCHFPFVALSGSSTEDSAVSSSTSDVTRVSSSAQPPAPRPWRGAPGACAPRTAERVGRPA